MNIWACALVAFSFTSASPLFAGEASGVHRYLYMSTPDGAQQEGGSEPGILVFDIDNGHRFVRRIDLPVFKEGLRGFTGSLVNQSLYFSTTNRRLGCFNLETETVDWEQQYPAGCDRTCITMDGSRLYVPTGWWYNGEDSGFLVVDAKDGHLIKRIPVGRQAHNSIASLAGDRVYLGTVTTLSVFDAQNGALLRQIPGVGEKGVFPYTITRDQKTAYVCLGGHVGFDVVDLTAGQKVHRVFAGSAPIPHRTHGAGLTPDESELWISDQVGKKLFIFDATQNPPTPKGSIELSRGGHGWVSFSLDGAYAWNHTPDIFDARTKARVGSFLDADGKPVCSSKFIEVHFNAAGKVVAMSNEFGLGRREQHEGKTP